jgi:hypothetical protein
MNGSKFPKCPLCYIRHKTYPKICSEVLIVNDFPKVHPKAKEFLEYKKKFEEVMANDRTSKEATINKF